MNGSSNNAQRQKHYSLAQHHIKTLNFCRINYLFNTGYYYIEIFRKIFFTKMYNKIWRLSFKNQVYIIWSRIKKDEVSKTIKKLYLVQLKSPKKKLFKSQYFSQYWVFYIIRITCYKHVNKCIYIYIQMFPLYSMVFL